MNVRVNRILKEESIILIYSYPSKNIKFTSYDALKKFIEKEDEFWGECNVGNAVYIYQRINRLYSNINSIEEQFENNKSLEDRWFVDSLIEHVANFSTGDISYNFFSGSPLAKRINELAKEDAKKMDAFISYIHGGNININNVQSLSGAIDADRYLNHNVFSNKFSKSYANILEEAVNEHLNEINLINTKYNDDLVKYSEESESLVNNTNIWRNNVENELQENLATAKKDLDILIEQKTGNLENLEKLYNEKLRLESPAKYWSDLEDKYKKEGSKWLGASVITSIIITMVLLFVLYYMPKELSIANIEFGLESLRSTLLLTIVISIGIYLLRLFVKMAVSAYHLSRDAKERYQLSYFYLSLIKESAIDAGDKAIILQSLFSRADTGLLKGDSSPAFPVDGMLAQIIKNIK